MAEPSDGKEIDVEGVIDFSKSYVDREKIKGLRKSALKKKAHTFSLESSVLVSTDDDVLNELQQVLVEMAPHLRRINFARSNVSGRIFYKGKEFPVADPSNERVTVEARSSDGRPVVRDDNPPRSYSDGTIKYYYVKTVFHEANSTFLRYYVMLDWFKNVTEIDMTGASISGYGLTSLVAATSQTLQFLRMGGCPIDNRGLYAIAELCVALRGLDIAFCPNVTAHGILYLSELAPAQIKQLEWVNISSKSLSLKFATAFLHSLEERGFRGVVFAGQAPDMPKRFFGTPRTRSMIKEKYDSNPDRIHDLCLTDLTLQTLRQFHVDANGDLLTANSNPANSVLAVSLDLTDQLINDSILDLVLARWGRRLYSLKLDGTFISDKGLQYLDRCPNLRILSLSRCWNIVSKSDANRFVMPAVNKMMHLKEVHIGDTRLSGRMFSEHPSLRVTTLIASRCPISVHAVRMLAEMCADSLGVLGLSGCSFLNSKALLYLMKFTKLESLDLSYCSGLSNADMQIFRERRSALKYLQTINVTGVKGMDRNACQDLANALSVDESSVSVVGGNQDGQLATVFRGESAMNSCPYSVVEPVMAIRKDLKGSSSTKDTSPKDTRHRIDLSDDDDNFYSPASPPIAKITPSTPTPTTPGTTDAYMVMPPGSVHSGLVEEKSTHPPSTSYTNLTHKDMVEGKQSKLRGVDDSSQLARSRSDNSETSSDTAANILSYSRFNESDLPPHESLPRAPLGMQTVLMRSHSEPTHDDSSKSNPKPD